MPKLRYDPGWDICWLAVDRVGHVGAFTTAGAGPIPEAAFETIDIAEAEVFKLPIVTRALTSNHPPAKAFMGFAEKGLFAFDWTDVHRVQRQEISAYERLAIPVTPINVNALGPTLAAIVSRVCFLDIVFLQDSLVRPDNMPD